MRNNASESKIEEKNPMWKGDSVGYAALHEWVTSRMPSPGVCEDCGKKSRLDLANKGKYDRNLDNWEWLCRMCHMKKDGRREKLIERNRAGRNKIKRNCLFCAGEFFTIPSRIKAGEARYCSKVCSNKGRYKIKNKENEKM